MESRGESELQQLVSNDADGENDDSIAQDDNTIPENKTTSIVRSTNVSSSGNTSHSSVSRGRNNIVGVNLGSRVLYINEKRPRNFNETTARPRNAHKDIPPSANVHHHKFLSEVPDVWRMEQALLELQADFHSDKLRAFGSGCTMEQMTKIREQQEKLAKLHFDLGSSNEPSLGNDDIKQLQNTMSELIQKLEQLSISIEGLHSNCDK